MKMEIEHENDIIWIINVNYKWNHIWPLSQPEHLQLQLESPNDLHLISMQSMGKILNDIGWIKIFSKYNKYF